MHYLGILKGMYLDRRTTMKNILLGIIAINLTFISFNLAMTLLTLIIMGIVYLKYVLPDVLIVKHRRNKYITSHDTESWKKYEV